MIKENNINIPITNRNKQYFINKGYTIEKTQTQLNIKTTDLNINSHFKITAICELCNKETNLAYYKYIQNMNRHNFYGCKSCSRIKTKLTCLDKYNETSYQKTTESKTRMKEICLEKYGVEYFIQNDEIKNKIFSTIKERYGVSCAILNKSIKDKSIKTLLSKYGVDHFSKSNKFKKIMKNKWIPFYQHELKIKYNIHDFKILDDNVLNIKCTEGEDHYFDTTYKLLYQRTELYNVRRCTICNPIKKNYSDAEYHLCCDMENITEIEKCNKSILNGKHIDIYLPKLNIGIEYNGLYWHSEKYSTEYDHQNKSLLAKNKNVKLFHLFEDVWKNNKLDILNLLTRNINNDYKSISNYKIIKSKISEIKYKSVFNGVQNKNNNIYILYDNDINIANIIFNNDTITYYNWNFDYNPTILFNIFIDDLKLHNYNYVHDLNNIFLDTTNLTFQNNIKPDYKYFFNKNKKHLELMNKHKINIKYKNNKKEILEHGYLKVYDSGYQLFKILT